MTIPEVEVSTGPFDAPNRFPLSSQQELWCANDPLGAFGPRFIVSRATRITGPVDVAALRGALDDVVARHELLRTVVVRHTQPRYQEVFAPMPVSLEVRDRPTDTGARDEAAQELLTELERSRVPVDELPLLRATLTRFDERDMLLAIATHHTVCDAWSLHLIIRDLAAFYAARTGERPLDLPPAPPYREYAQWQIDSVSGPAADTNMAYWRRRLDGHTIFALPTDRPVPPTHTMEYSSCGFSIDSGTAAAAARLAKTTRCSTFMVMLAVFDVLAHRITGTLDPVINTMIHGRGQPRFAHTVGPFLNFLALHTDLRGCASFRDVLTRTRNSCLEAYEHEVPISMIENDIPALMAPLADPRNCDFIFGYFEPPNAGGLADPVADPFRIGERSQAVRRQNRVSEQIPGGAAWSMGLIATGEVLGSLQFNEEEFDAGTAAGWVAEYGRLVRAATSDPDRDWQAL